MPQEDQLAKTAQGLLEELVLLLAPGHLEKYGNPSSPGKARDLLEQIVSTAGSILNHEMETLSVEQLGKRGIRRIETLLQRARTLPGVEIEQNLTERLNKQHASRKLRPIERKESQRGSSSS